MADTLLWQTLLSGAEGPVITGVFGFVAGFFLRGWQGKREDLAHKRAEDARTLDYKHATADRNKTLIFPAYQAIAQFVRSVDGISSTVKHDQSVSLAEQLDAATIALRVVLDEISAYALINKEDEVSDAISDTYSALCIWAGRDLSYRGKTGDRLPVPTLEKVNQAKAEFKEKRTALLNIARTWE